MIQHRASLGAFASKGWGLRRWVLVGLLLLAWALRLPPLVERPLHPDEALYGYWGLLINQGRDPWLTGGPVYKPPLLPYVVSLCQLLFGDTTIALRLPGLLAGMLAVPLVGVLARRLYQDLWTGLVATVVAGLSPFAIGFSGTGFPDPLMVTLGLGACVAAAQGSPRWAGLLAGLSFTAKQTGLVWLPLALGVAVTACSGSAVRLREFIISYLAPVMLAFAWDGVRVRLGGDSFWSAGVVGYGGLRLIWSHELWPRLHAWSQLTMSLFGSPPVNALLLAGLPTLAWAALTRHRGERHAAVDVLLISFCFVYGLLHWLVAFPVWSRYLLPLTPVMAVLLGRLVREAVSLIARAQSGSDVEGQRRWGTETLSLVFALLLALLLALPAWRVSAGRSSLTEERAVYRGIEDVVSFCAGLPEGSVVYHHWLGWHYHYGLFNDPIYLAYWPTPVWLAQDVQAFGRENPRYVAFPGWESSARVERALQDVGYALDPALTVTGGGGDSAFVVYHIVPSLTP